MTRSFFTLLSAAGLLAFGVAVAAGQPPDKAKPAPDKTLTLDLGDGVKLELVRIEPDEFMMGSPAGETGRHDDEKQHKVRIEKPFYMGVYEVTQGQYKAVTGENPSHFKGSDDLPVEQVCWHDAVDFCKKLSQKTGRTVRLPTEAEWEYACRAGTTTPFSFGRTISTAEANYDGNYTYGNGVKGVDREKTIPVGSLKKPNAWGLHDMHGNVGEWTSSKYAEYPYKADDGREEAGGAASRVLRGSSWHLSPDYLRAAIRGKGPPGAWHNSIGFRVCVSVASPELP